MDGLKPFAEKFRSADEPLEVHPTVLHGETLVVEQQLFFAIKDDVLGVQLVDALLEGVALDLKFVAAVGGGGAAQGVRMVAVGDAQNLERAVARQPDLRWVDGGVEAFEHDSGKAAGQIHFGDAFDLGSLLVNDNVIDGRFNGQVAVVCFVVRCPTQGREQGEAEGQWSVLHGR